MKEIRVAEIRADATAEAGSLILVGTPIVYDIPTTIHDPAGEYIEMIQRGALDSADLSDVHLLYNHDATRVPLARTPRTMMLTLTPAGLEMKAVLPETAEARAVYEAVKRGDLTGMSFAFTVNDGGSRYDAQTNTRTITSISKVLECSIVPFPAYPMASVEARNERAAGLKTLARKQARREARREARRLVNQILKVRI